MKIPSLLSNYLTLTITIVHSRALPVTPPRTFGNFQPTIKNSFKFLDSSSNPQFLMEDRFQAARRFFAADVKVDLAQVKVSSSHTSKHNGVTHVYFQQILLGIPVNNGHGNINILPNLRVHSLGSSFYTGRNSATRMLKPKYSAADAVKAFAKLLNVEVSSNLIERSVKNYRVQSTLITGVTSAIGPVKSELNYLQTENGLRLVRKITVDMINNYYTACVDTESNEILSLIDSVFEASYNVIPFGVHDPREGQPRLVVNPEDRQLASPLGWHNYGLPADTRKTHGNNIVAQANPSGGPFSLNQPRPTGQIVGGTVVFRYDANFSQDPTTYKDASTVQLFYMTNIMHDVSYQYGFTEAAGNFQVNNFGRGGNGHDRVIANTQDGDLQRHPSFLTQVDGKSSALYMRIFTRNNAPVPWRDSSYDSSIVIHEYAHGISSRLTGGRMKVGCLSVGESAGMSEGWSDMFAVMFQSNESTNRTKPFFFMSYVLQTNPNDGPGIRLFPYTTDMTVNPSTYAYTIRPAYINEVHNIGEVWAAILNEVYWNLVEKHGFQKDWYKTNASEAEGGKLGGNVIFAQLLIDAMKLQPCNPNFIQARNAIIEADGINNNLDNFYELWTGFAKRGLGTGAGFPGHENFAKPDKPTAPTTPTQPANQTPFLTASAVLLKSASFTFFTIRFLLTLNRI